MSGLVDFHSHVLPGIDDGSVDLDTSLRMLRRCADQGISHVIATPHFYARQDSPDHFLRKRKESEEILREAMEKDPSCPKLSIGAEVRFFPGMSHCDELPVLTIQGENCILIEMTGVPWTDSMYQELERIRERFGILPVIAHVDRYIRPFRTHGIPRRLEQLPVLVQANAGFFLDRRTAPMAMRMLKKDQIHLLGSDCHDLDHRPPNLGLAAEKIRRRLGQEALDRIQYYEKLALTGDTPAPKRTDMN